MEQEGIKMMDEKTQRQIELMTSCSYDDWDINQHYCWKVQCNECKLRKPPNPDGSEFTYGECRNYARAKADELKKGERSAECETPKYEKFMVLYNKPGNPPNAVPWTGLEQTIQYVHDKLEEGYTVKIKPFTREDWANKV